MRAAHEMIRTGGGPAAFPSTRPGILVDLQGYTPSGCETRGSSLSSDQSPLAAIPFGSLARSSHEVPELLSPPCSPLPIPLHMDAYPCNFSNALLCQTMSPSPIEDLRLSCEEFLDFLRRCEQLALYQKSNMGSGSPSRYTAVCCGTTAILQSMQKLS